jgi:hypothetical protein
MYERRRRERNEEKQKPLEWKNKVTLLDKRERKRMKSEKKVV